MESDSKVARVIQKIRALLKLSESTHSQAERESAMSLAQELIAQYQVAQADIDAANGKAEEQDDLEGKVIFESARASGWKSELAFAVASLNNTFCLKFSGVRGEASHKRGSRWRVFGKPSDIEITQYMFESLVTTITELSKQYVPFGLRRGVNPERESWALGCVRGFITKMTQAKAGVLATANQSTAMVLVNRPKEIEGKVLANDKTLKLRAGVPSKAQIKNTAFQSGFQKGGTLSVNPGMGASGNVSKLSS